MKTGRIWGSAMCFLGAGLVGLGAALPYAPNCTVCRVLLPQGISWFVWLPIAAHHLSVMLIALVFGFRLALRAEGSRYAAGFLTGTGILAVVGFLPYGIHPRAPGGAFGLGGLVAMTGGALILAAGVLAFRLALAAGSIDEDEEAASPSVRDSRL